jgi:hypothetical protein
VPLAILLQERMAVLTKGLKKVERWQTAMETFTLVIDRLRSAYLVAWFGTPLPTAGLQLKVAFANMDELRRRWIAIGAGRKETPPAGPNLLEPLLGMGGTLTGVLASPMYSILLGLALGSLIDRWYVAAYAVANWLTAGLLGTAIFTAGAVALPYVLLAWAVSGRPRELFDFLGAAADLAEPLWRFWLQVTGPREAVRNPLLRELLLLGDRIAALTSLLLGAFAVVVTRVGPLLEPMRVGLVATANLTQELWLLLVFVVRQTIDFAVGLVAGPDSVATIVSSVVGLLTRAFTRLGASLGRAWDTISGFFSSFFIQAELAAAAWARWGVPFIRTHTIDHPTVAYVRSFISQLAVAAAWRRRTAPPPAPPPPPSSPGLVGRLTGWVVSALTAGMPKSTPSFPTLPSLPPTVPLGAIGPLARGALKLGVVANPLELGAEATAVLRRAAHPPIIFAGEWSRLGEEAQKKEPLERALETATYLSLVERIVSPAAAQRVQALEGILSRLDAYIRKERPRQPVLDVPEPTELRPVIATLRVRAHGSSEPALRAWVEDLKAAFGTAPYPIPAER